MKQARLEGKKQRYKARKKPSNVVRKGLKVQNKEERKQARKEE